ATLLFTGNETHAARLWGAPNPAPFVKDAFHRHVVDREPGAVDPAEVGTKAAAHLRFVLAGGATRTLRLRLVRCPARPQDPPPGLPSPHAPPPPPTDPFADFDAVFADRRREADEFYAAIQPPTMTPEERDVHRQALAGM